MLPRIVTFVALVACSAPPKPTTPAARSEDDAPSPSTKAIAEPFAPRPSTEPAPRISRRGPSTVVMLDGMNASPMVNLRPDDIAQKRSDLWDPCVRDFVLTRAAEIRDDLGDALTQAMTTCVRDTRTVTFEPPRSGRAYATGSHVGIAGVLTPTTTELVLRVVTRGHPPDRLTILAGGTRWTSTALDVTHDAIWGRELAAIPYTKRLARIVRHMLDTDGALLRFESATGIEDVPVTEELAIDLRAMIDVFDEL